MPHKVNRDVSTTSAMVAQLIPQDARAKATQLPRNWSALYQQRPAPETGDYFEDEWFRTYAREPPRQTLNVYGGI